MYGRSFEGGWNGYYLAGRRVPAGKILAFDDQSVYGYGREPRYFKWTTPMEFHLFAAPRTADTDQSALEDEGSIIRIDKSESLNPAGTPVAAMAWVRAQQPDGVVVARGAHLLGYSLYLKGGVPHFAARVDGEAADVSADEAVPDDWTHLAGVLTAEGELRIYVNGSLAGTSAGPGLIPKDPAESMQIGGDEGGAVGDYEGGLPFKGIIDEVRVYHGALPEAAIRSEAGLGEQPDMGPAELVLNLTFGKENASDTSGQKNHGTIVGAKPARGIDGAGMRFSGRLPAEVASGVTHTWSGKVPLLVRGLVVADRTLFVAGPDDLLDEPTTLGAIADPETVEKLSAQQAALAGRSGGLLRAVACADGSVLSEQRLDTIPVWDGMAAAEGSLYLAAIDGTVRCYRAAQP
jgi:hypothetical protein